MVFEWDDAKARSNNIKHDVAFDLAVEVWDDPFHLVLFDRTVGGEERWHAFGLVGAMTVLMVVHCHVDPDDNERVRIISARKATSHERKRYEQENS